MIVIDTHIWLWWMNEDVRTLGKDRHDCLQTADFVGVSAISCFEVAWLDVHGRIDLPCELLLWFEKALEGSGITLIPVTPEIAVTAVNLREHHSDPQDRIIIATALCHDAKLVSADKKFLQYEEISGRLL